MITYRYILTVLLFLFSSLEVICQVDCTNALALTPGSQQCGDSPGQPGNFPDDGSSPENPCHISFNGDEYWFEYSAQETGERLDLIASNISENSVGLFVFDDCPDSSPSCNISDTNIGNNSDDLLVQTLPLTAGVSYKIAIIRINGSTSFCLDATVIPPTGCEITSIVAGAQTPCDTVDNQFEQDVIITFNMPPGSGQLDVNNQQFSIGPSPQTVTLVGLNSDGAQVDVTAFFTDDIYCTLTETNVFTAPSTCIIGSACDNAVVLTPGTQQCGNSSGQSGSFPDNGNAPVNPCDNSYNDGEYWFEHSPQEDGEILELLISGITDNLTGLFVFDNCPGSTPSCITFDVNNGSSTSDLMISTPPLSLGTTYKIAIANEDLIDSYSTAFCLDATIIPPTGCSITSVTVGSQSSCDPSNNQYTQDVIITFENPLSTGQVDVNGQLFAIGTSPQTITLTGLAANENPVDVTAFFTDDIYCTLTETALFNAPTACIAGSACDNSVILTPGTQQCGNSEGYTGSFPGNGSAPNNPCHVHHNDAEYWYTYTAQNSGEILELSLSSITGTWVGLFVLDDCPGSSPTCIESDVNSGSSTSDLYVATPTLTAGVEYKIVVATWFSYDNYGTSFCLDAILHPPTNCNISDVSAGSQSVCDANTDEYSQDIIVTYTDPPASGSLRVNEQYFIIETSPQTVTLTELLSDGNAVDIAVDFTDDLTCSFLQSSVFTAPEPCKPGATCQIAVGLSPGTQQCDNSNGNQGSFGTIFDSNENPCNSSYTDNEFWFEYSPSVSGEILDLTVSGLTETFVGLFVINQCPDSTPSCLAHEVNTNSTSDISLSTPPLYTGTTYKIALAMDDLFSIGSFSFCLDVIVQPPSGCTITSITAGAQTICDPVTGEYTQEVTISYDLPPNTGQLNVNGQLFTIGSSPQTEILVGLISDGNPVDVSAFFTDDVFCSLIENSAFTAPEDCLEGSMCETPKLLTPGTQQCGDSAGHPGDFPLGGGSPSNPCQVQYNADEYWYEYTPVETGEILELTLSNISNFNAGLFVFDNCPSSSPNCLGSDTNAGSDTGDLFVTTPSLTAGISYKIAIANRQFSSYNTAFCLDAVLYSPTDCEITSIGAGNQGSCDPLTGIYTQEVIVTYNMQPTMGQLEVNGQSFTITSSPQTVTLTGLIANGESININAEFTDDITCSFFQQDVFTAPPTCIPSASCATAILLTPGNQQCGNSQGQPGDFDGDGGSPFNPCGSNYNDDEYWLEYIAQDSGEILVLMASGITEPYAGLFLFNNCPDSSPSCLASDQNLNSTNDLTITSSPLTEGVTYKIMISNYGIFSNDTEFCLDATVFPPTDCDIVSVAVGSQSSCDTTNNLYTQEIIVTYEIPPNSGQMNVNDQLFEIESSPQTITLVGLIADGLAVDLNIEFTDDPTCTFFESDFFTAQESCIPGSSCGAAVAVTPGSQQCGNSQGQAGSFPNDGSSPSNPCIANYNADEYWFEYSAQTTGETLELLVSGITQYYTGLFVLDGCLGMSPNCIADDVNYFSLNDLNLNTPLLSAGQVYKIVIVNWNFLGSSTAFCLDVIVHPPPPCNIFYTGVHTSCGENNGQITADVIMATGEVSYTLDGASVSMPVDSLMPGSYAIIATDEDGCTISETISINSSQNTDVINANYVGPAVGSWNVSSHWDDGRIPTACTIVNIASGKVVFTDTGTENLCKILDLDSGSQLNIKPNSTIHINGQ